MPRSKQILLVGSGPMSIEYAKALKSLKYSIIIIGRGRASAKIFQETIGQPVITGGIDRYVKNHILPETAIVAVSEENLAKVSTTLIINGVKNLLIEKPGGLTFQEINNLPKLAKQKSVNIYIAYNRRFYSSVKQAQSIIRRDGGITSIFFDFTEATFRITSLKKAPHVKENWFLQNSTHVIDLAFFLAGQPKKLTSYKTGKLSWHPNGSIFSGAGVTQKKALFSYIANWDSPGRWNIEIMTKKHKLILKPLEQLQIQNYGSFDINKIIDPDLIDQNYKPGLYNEVRSFLGNKKNLCTLQEHISNLRFYKAILKTK